MRLFDLHCDTLTKCTKRGVSLHSNDFDWDVARGLRLADSWVQVMAAYVPDTVLSAQGFATVEAMFRYLRNEADFHDNVVIVDSVSALRRARCERRAFILPAVENGHAIGHDLRLIDRLADQHVAYLTLTWNGSNVIGNGCLSSNRDGLTPFGKQVVRRLYERGMMPDVSHLNERGFFDVAALSDGRPFIASHSLSKSVCDHPRSLSDEQFCAVRDSGGLVGLNLCVSQLGGEDLSLFARHVEHFLTLDGERTVALGLDLDGTELPPFWNGIGVVETLRNELVSHGIPTPIIQRLFFENSFSFFEKALTFREECIRIGT